MAGYKLSGDVLDLNKQGVSLRLTSIEQDDDNGDGEIYDDDEVDLRLPRSAFGPKNWQDLVDAYEADEPFEDVFTSSTALDKYF